MRSRDSGRAHTLWGIFPHAKSYERSSQQVAVGWIAPLVAAMPNGTAVTLQHFMSERDFERTALYNEVMRPANGF